MLSQKEIKRNHSNSWRNIWRIYNANQKFYRGVMFKTTIVLNIALFTLALVLDVDIFLTIHKTTDLYLSVLPNLLGFNLGAYALLIGLASSSILLKLTKDIDKGFTFFQKASGVFAISIVTQAFTLLTTFIIKQVIIFQETDETSYNQSLECLIMGANFCVFIFLNFLGIYSLLLILMIVKNIFGLSQTANLLSGIENINKEKSTRK